MGRILAIAAQLDGVIRQGRIDTVVCMQYEDTLFRWDPNPDHPLSHVQ